MKEHAAMSHCLDNNHWWNTARLSSVLLLAAMLLVGCGQSDRLGAETTPRPAYPAPNAAAAVAPGATPDGAYPVPPTSPPVPTDATGFIDYASGEIGIIIDTRNNTVVDVVPDSPAQAADIQVGDVITQVEDKGVGDKFKEAKKIMGGKLHKKVKVEILRQGKKRVLSIEASTLILPTAAPDQPTPTPILDPYTYL